MLSQVRQAFAQHFPGEPPFLARAPGRVNLIGEHTDYNDGFVLPMAIDRDICIAFRPRADKLVVVHSLDYGETVEIDLTRLVREEHSWAEYVKGVAWALRESGHTLSGWEGVIAGDVPRGAGLSSSAALELAVMRAFAALSAAPWEPAAAALAGQRVENQWIGVNSGIMDQMVVAGARAGHALLLDCRSLAVTHVPVPDAIAVVVLDTGTRRGLVDSAYNERRRQCEAAARFFGAAALRDVGVAELNAAQSSLDDLTFRRARHVITEDDRTTAAAVALRDGALDELGRLMNESHTSLRDDFEVTNTALDAMVAAAQAQAGCYGARMTGAGFGGCAVAIIERAAAARVIEGVLASYRASTGLDPQAYACRAADGASLEVQTSMEGVPS